MNKNDGHKSNGQSPMELDTFMDMYVEMHEKGQCESDDPVCVPSEQSLPMKPADSGRSGLVIAAQDELDLHGANADQAERVLREFIAHAHREMLGCVRVVHGKGLHVEAPFGGPAVPVVKNVVDRVLRQRGDVLAFHSAPAAQGGTGAVLVLLAPRRR